MSKKLIIEGFSDKTLNSSTGSCELQINPEKISQSYGIQLKEERAIKTYKKVPTYVTRALETLTFDFYIDGTGVVPLGDTVSGTLKDLRATVYDYDGEIHRSRYLRVMWGDLNFPCSLKTMKVSYELFNSSGSVLRAKVNMSFLEHITEEEVAKKSKTSSPDLTHHRTAKPGDTLPGLCYEVYGDSAHYLTVAKKNNLDSLTAFKPGDVLMFPPVEG